MKKESEFDLPLESLQRDEADNLINGYTDAKTLEQAYIECYDKTAWRFRMAHMNYWLNQRLTK